MCASTTPTRRSHDNEIRIVLDVRIVDACGVVIHTIDVNAHVTVTFRFTVFDGELFVTRSTDIDASNADVSPVPSPLAWSWCSPAPWAA